jgi:hypothetical protein
MSQSLRPIHENRNSLEPVIGHRPDELSEIVQYLQLGSLRESGYLPQPVMKGSRLTNILRKSATKTDLDTGVARNPMLTLKMPMSVPTTLAITCW